MDFKVVGNSEGISALQMDIKISGLTRETMASALEQAREGRLHILAEMAKCISEPALDLSDYAPRMFTIKINPEKIRDLIGPGGKHIRGIVADTGAIIDVTDDGTVTIAATNGTIAEAAIEQVKNYTEEAEIGKLYEGVVARITDFGAFVTILPGTDGLVHISEMDIGRVGSVEEVCSHGDKMLVKVVDIDRQGKVRLSRREVLLDEKEAAGEDVSELRNVQRGPPRRDRNDRGGRDDRRGGGGGRGGRDRDRR
jgi:polyribonucleotide nucleotidyltransferase